MPGKNPGDFDRSGTMRNDHSPTGDCSVDHARADHDSPSRKISKAWARESYRANYDLSAEDERNVFGSRTVEAGEASTQGRVSADMLLRNEENNVTSSEKTGSSSTIRRDAEGQFAKAEAGRKNSGVASAKPTVITGSEDATAHKVPPGKEPPPDEWDSNYDVGEHPTGR
jgi:hypothetical protein